MNTECDLDLKKVKKKRIGVGGRGAKRDKKQSVIKDENDVIKDIMKVKELMQGTYTKYSEFKKNNNK